MIMNTPSRYSALAFLKAHMLPLLVVACCVIPATAGANLSMSNKVTSIEIEGIYECSSDQSVCRRGAMSVIDCPQGNNNRCTRVGDGDNLLIGVATNIYHTVGINPACSRDDIVAIPLDAVTPIELMEQQRIIQLLETARIGPFKIKFEITEDQCADTSFPGKEVCTQVPIGTPDCHEIPPEEQSHPVATGVRLIQFKEACEHITQDRDIYKDFCGDE